MHKKCELNYFPWKLEKTVWSLKEPHVAALN